MYEESGLSQKQVTVRAAIFCLCMLLSLLSHQSHAQTAIEFNSNGGTSATNGLHFYIDRSTKIQVRRLNNTGQVYSPTALPQTNPNSLNNGVFIRANGLLYGPSHTVSTFNPSGGMFSSYSISAAAPANPSSAGVQQSASNSLGISGGPQATIVWKYTTPLDFLTAEVTLTIPAAYSVSASNPVRYYHVFDTYLGGSDSGCGVLVSGGNRIVGTYSSLGGANPCPTSTALPSAGTIVESFRERAAPSPPPGGTALNTFSSYCAAGWSTFFAAGTPHCSVTQLTRPLSTTGAMSNTITTTLQDTGIGIAYDFIAPGTYTFSYDFVIGSTVVPDYDHIEIRHDGSATLCPETLKVLACTSSTVPCPDLNIVNSGNLTGAISLAPTATGVSYTPTSFSLGSANTQQDIVLQAAAASAGTYTLFASGLSKLPLNGTRCVVGGVAQASCQITIANTPCASKFECMESGLSYNNPITATNRNPLYSKLANVGFRFDVLALQTSGTVVNSYTGSVAVELMEENGSPACNVPVAIASQNLTFAAGDNGRKTLTADFNLPDAYKKLRCRVKENVATAPVTACSSDTFTVRAQSFTSIVSNANADNAGTSVSATPMIAAGNNFTLTVNTGTKGYDGLPKINAGLLQWLSAPPGLSGGKAPPGTGVLSGSFSLAANVTNGNGASGTAFKYDEVGYFRFLQNGIYDDTFIANSNSADVVNGDCIASSFANIADASSNPLMKGRFGCNIGNPAVSNHFGRFIPHHFTISENTLQEACPAALPNTTFSYFGQDGFVTNFKLTAENISNLPTRNYSASFAKFNVSNYASYNFSMSGAPVGSVLAVSSTAPTGSWFGGEATISVKHQISRPTALENQTSIGILAAPTDGEVTASAPFTIATSTQRYGRMRLQNAYGSEMLDLPVPYFAEYRNNNLWLKNTDDSCSAIVAPSVGSGVIFYPDSATNHLIAGETVASVSATGKLIAGDAKLKFSKPGLGNDGHLDLDIPVSPWLKFPWRGGLTPINPAAKLKFGSYKKSNQFIYLREVH
nr:DUF6701 domain-containing protein [uncultured Undibacterium sp.]